MTSSRIFRGYIPDLTNRPKTAQIKVVCACVRTAGLSLSAEAIGCEVIRRCDLDYTFPKYNRTRRHGDAARHARCGAVAQGEPASASMATAPLRRGEHMGDEISPTSRVIWRAICRHCIRTDLVVDVKSPPLFDPVLIKNGVKADYWRRPFLHERAPTNSARSRLRKSGIISSMRRSPRL